MNEPDRNSWQVDTTCQQLRYAQYLLYGQSQGDDLLGFIIDVNAYVCDEKICFFVSAERLDNPNCMLVLHCQFAEQVNRQFMADYLQQKWLKYIRYSEFEKHHICWVDDELHFYYVTRSRSSSDSGLGVTGKIVAR